MVLNVNEKRNLYMSNFLIKCCQNVLSAFPLSLAKLEFNNIKHIFLSYNNTLVFASKLKLINLFLVLS